MTSDFSKFQAASGGSDSTFSDSDATVISGAEPSNVGPTTASENASAFFDDASTKTSSPPLPLERDEEIERLANERTVVSSTPGESEPPADEPAETGDGGALPPGAKFGHFVVTKYIGGGGMGRVYEGRDTALDRKVAIKVLPRQRARDVGAVARFLNEAKSAARLNHEHIAQVYFCGEENGVPFIAFEYVRGVNLRDYVRERGVLELGEAIDYVLQAADALAHAAEHGVTHRDVKPSNIIVSPEKSVKLIDMGLARLLKSDLTDDLTESGVTLGTFDYISPEQARDPRAADVRSDVYSLGCTFYYMLVGTPPFPEGTMLQKLLQHQGDEPPDVREANPEIPVEVAAVVKKMMRKAPEDRYQTPRALILDLYEIAEMIGLRVADRGVPDAAVVERSASTVPARTPAAIACVLLALFVVALRWTSGGSTIPLPVVETPTAPVATSSVPSETNSTESGGASPSTTDAAGGAFAVESETSASSVRVETAGETFGAAEIDAARVEGGVASDAVPPLVVDDGSEWRRTFLSGSATSGESARVAWGWRARRRVAAALGSVDELENASFRAIAYSFLGTTSTAARGSGTGAASASASASLVRTVDRVGGGEQTFATLQAALAVGAGSTDGAPIRVALKFDGALATPPISLVGRKVEIVAAEGFRPTLAFDPRGGADGGWSERMFLLNSSELTLRGVAIDFTVPAQDVVASKWSVFESIGATVLTLIDSSATVCNATGEAFSAPLHSNVAIFRSTFDAAALDGLDVPTGSDGGRAVPSVRLDGVFARGEAALFATNGVGGVFEARRSGFNVSGAIFWGSEEERTGTGATLTFDRVVVAGRSSLVVRSERDDASGALPPLAVSLTNSVVWLDGEPLALVQSSRTGETSPPSGTWDLDGSLLLDAEPSLRTKSRQTAAVRSGPLAFDEPPNASAKLGDLNPNAVARLAETPPHRFESGDFGRWILEPAQTSSALDAATRTLVEETRARLFKAASGDRRSDASL